MPTIFLDIETRSSDVIPDIDSIKAPANYTKPETILKYQQEHQDESWRRQALDSMQGEIICIGYAFEDCDPLTFCHLNEADVMVEFANDIRRLEGVYNDPLRFCGWNIGSFDLPWIWRKAAKYSMHGLRKAIPRNNAMFVDLMKVWAADYKDYVSLTNCAKFLGIEHEGNNGAEIHDIWQLGDLDAIAEHCRRDIVTTREIYRRIYT